MKTPMRHGIAVLLVLLLCASLFLVYNGSFNGASRDANDTRVRPHEQLRRPTEASVRVAKPRPPVLQGYSGIIDHKEPASVETSNVDDCEKFSWQSFLRRNAVRLSTSVSFGASGDVRSELTAHFMHFKKNGGGR